LFSRKTNNVINWITKISVAVVAIVSGSLIVILSAMNGLSSSVMDLYTNFDPDLKIEEVTSNRFNPDSIPFQEISNIRGIKYIVQSIEETTLLKYGDNQEVATVKGVSNDFPRMTNIESSIIDGYYGLFVGGAEECVLGFDLAMKLGVNTDSNYPIHMYIPNLIGSSVGPGELFRETISLPRGLFDINSDFNRKYIIISIDKAQKLLRINNEINTIEIGVDSNFDVEIIQEKIKKLIGKQFSVKTRFEQNEFLFKSINAEKWITLLILTLVIVLAIFNVMGSLTMLVIDKKKDIFIFQSMGATLKNVRSIFWIEGLLITFSGAFIGLTVGYLLIIAQLKFCFFAYGSGGRLECFPFKVQTTDILIILAIVNTIGALASIVPIRRIK
jgi:lipoprotein-releasing system permease protein